MQDSEISRFQIKPVHGEKHVILGEGGETIFPFDL